MLFFKNDFMNDIEQIFQDTFSASKALLRFSDGEIHEVLMAIADEMNGRFWDAVRAVQMSDLSAVAAILQRRMQRP